MLIIIVPTLSHILSFPFPNLVPRLSLLGREEERPCEQGCPIPCPLDQKLL